MSVTKDKTLAKVRTFAQDFNEQQLSLEHVGATEPAVQTLPLKVVESKAIPTIVVPKKSTSPAAPALPKITVVSKKETAEPVVAVPPAKAVPSFHQLQQKFDNEFLAEPVSQVTPPKTIKIKTRTKDKKSPSRDVDAMVITATKRSAPKKPPTPFLTSVGNWFSTLFKNFSKKETPKYTVQDSVRRKGVIEKATTKSGAVFTADNDTLREQILRRREAELRETDVTWSPYTDAGYELLEAPKKPDAGVQVTYKKRNLPEPEITEPAPRGRDFYDEHEVDSTAAPEVTPLSIGEPEVPLHEPAPELITEPVASLYEPELISEAVVAPTADTEEIAIPEPSPYDQKETFQSASRDVKLSFLTTIRAAIDARLNTSFNTNTIALGAVAVITSVVLFVFVARAFMGVLLPENDSVPQQIATPIIPGTLVIAVPVIDVSDASLRTLINQSDAFLGAPEQEIKFVDSNNQPLSPQAITEVLGLRINPNLEQTITNLHILVVDNTQHAIVFTVSDPVTALGGMLEWETNMEQDLRTILRTVTVPSESKRFVDTSFGFTDTRVLTDGVDEVLVYGFLNENTVLITKTTDTFIRMTE